MARKNRRVSASAVFHPQPQGEGRARGRGDSCQASLTPFHLYHDEEYTREHTTVEHTVTACLTLNLRREGAGGETVGSRTLSVLFPLSLHFPLPATAPGQSSHAKSATSHAGRGRGRRGGRDGLQATRSRGGASPGTLNPLIRPVPHAVQAPARGRLTR